MRVFLLEIAQPENAQPEIDWLERPSRGGTIPNDEGCRVAEPTADHISAAASTLGSGPSPTPA